MASLGNSGQPGEGASSSGGLESSYGTIGQRPSRSLPSLTKAALASAIASRWPPYHYTMLRSGKGTKMDDKFRRASMPTMRRKRKLKKRSNSNNQPAVEEPSSDDDDDSVDEDDNRPDDANDEHNEADVEDNHQHEVLNFALTFYFCFLLSHVLKLLYLKIFF